MSELVGKAFHIFGDDGTPARQGEVVAQINDDTYLVQYFDWIIGEETTMQLVRIDDMVVRGIDKERSEGAWQFYKDTDGTTGRRGTRVCNKLRLDKWVHQVVEDNTKVRVVRPKHPKIWPLWWISRDSDPALTTNLSSTSK